MALGFLVKSIVARSLGRFIRLDKVPLFVSDGGGYRTSRLFPPIDQVGFGRDLTLTSNAMRINASVPIGVARVYLENVGASAGEVVAAADAGQVEVLR